MRLGYLAICTLGVYCALIAPVSADSGYSETPHQHALEQHSMAGSPDSQVGADGLGVWRLRQSVNPGDLYHANAPSAPAVFDHEPQLRGLISVSLERSDALKAAHLRAAADAFSADAAFAKLLPTVSFSAELAHAHNSRSVDRGWIGGNVRDNASITAEWTVFSSGANWAAYESSQLRAQASAYGYLAAERQAALEQLGVYLQLLTADRLTAAIGTTLWRLSKIRQSTQALERSGFASQTDLAQIDAEIHSVRAEHESAKSLRRRQAIAWKDFTGTPAPAKLKTPDPSKLMPGSKDAMLDAALGGSYRIAQAETVALASDAHRDAVKRQYLPRVSAYGTFGVGDHGSAAYGDDYDLEIGLRLNVPLIDFAAAPRYREARARAQADWFAARDTHRRVRSELLLAWEAYHSERNRYAQFKRQAASLRHSVKGLTKQLEAGLRPVDDLLREEIALTQANINARKAQISAIAAAYRILVHLDQFDAKNPLSG